MSQGQEELRLRKLQQYNLLDTPREEAFDRITRLVTALLNVPIAAVTLVDRDRQWFKSEQGLGVSETPRDQSFCAHAMASYQPLIVEDARLDGRFSDNPLVTGQPEIRFYVGIPLRSGDGTPIGALCGIDTKPRGIGQRELEVMADLANLTMEQLELRLLATLDGLTGTLRRIPFMASASRDLALSKRQGDPLSCLMLDADNFKRINDRWGHAIGDDALVKIASATRSVLRATDTIGRIGGEEFCVFLPQTDLAGAMQVAERIRSSISAIRFSADELTVTVSVGVAEVLPSDASPADVMRRADTALYLAKSSGRNRIAA